MRPRVHSIGIFLVAGALAACSHTQSPRARTESIPERRERPPRESRAPVEEEPVVDAATMADGRTLAAVGREGFLSTWQLFASTAAPLSDAEEAALGSPCEGESCSAPRVFAFDHFRLELGDLVQSNGRSVYLGATLLVPRRTHVTLMVGMRGAAQVRLDGVRVASGESPDHFRRDRLVQRVELSEGEHRLVVRFDKPEEGRWRGAVRFLSERHRPGAGNVAIALGRIEEARAAELAANAVRIDEHHLLGENGPVVRVRAHLPGGGVRVPIEVHIGETHATLESTAGVHEMRHEVSLDMPARGAMRIVARVGARELVLGTRALVDRRALEAALALDRAFASAPAGARAPIAWRRDELLRAVREHDPDQAWRTLLIGESRRITRSLERGRDPFADIHGYERMAFFSRLDGTAQEYELFVPPAYRANQDRRWPLVVTLHGFKGNAGDYFRNTFGLARDFSGGETLDAHGRHGAAPTSGPMFVIGPTGRGQSFYRHFGEIDVLEAIEDVRARFPSIDPDRIYITGGSMGGTGAAYLPYRHPDLFAASAALAGYHDQRIRADTDHASLSDVERFLTAHRSDIDWAENGVHLPILLVRGTRDMPLEWTRCLVRRLNQLGYRCEHREPELGHNVWTDTYANGAIFDWFARHRRPSQPSRVILRTARERTRRAWWVSVEERDAPNVFAHVDARMQSNVITARIEGARAVTFDPRPPLAAPSAPITVRIGESSIEGTAPITIERTDGGWRRTDAAFPSPGSRRAGLDGPIREVFHEPLTFVVGTQDPDHTFVNRLVARRWANPKGVIVEYPIVDDVDVTDAMIANSVLVLIGPPSSNSVLARIADRLPIRITSDAIELGGIAHRGDEVGTAFVTPNPLNPDRLTLVIAGPRPLGTFRSIALPDILPDYVVFDERVASARDRWACGGSEGCAYRAHGFFDMRWQLPSAP